MMNSNRIVDHLYLSMDNVDQLNAMSNDKNDAFSHPNTMMNDEYRHHLQLIYFHYLTAELFHQDLEKEKKKLS